MLTLPTEAAEVVLLATPHAPARPRRSPPDWLRSRAPTVALRGNHGLSDVVEATLGAEGHVTRLVTHWINGPNMLAPAALESGSAVWLGRFVAEGDGWVFTLDAPSHLSERFSAARLNRAQFVFSHVGELRRADGSTFDVGAAEEVMFSGCATSRRRPLDNAGDRSHDAKTTGPEVAAIVHTSSSNIDTPAPGRPTTAVTEPVGVSARILSANATVRA